MKSVSFRPRPILRTFLFAASCVPAADRRFRVGADRHHRQSRRHRRDAQGGALPGVTITAVHTATGTSYETVTDAQGRFDILNVRGLV